LLEFPIREVAGKTLGIIGYGAIGKRVKQVAEAFGMKVLIAQSITGGVEASDERVSLEHVYQHADIISIHCPLSPYSKNLINSDAFALMKPTAIVLNMGRGGIVDEQALIKALNSGKIAAAATDVLTQEPPAKDHVLLTNTHPRLIITPHTAWASREARQVLVQQVVEIIQGFQHNHIINQVNQ
jgi:glycerate dehydrogenase